jgi:hypothetical protein
MQSNVYEYKLEGPSNESRTPLSSPTEISMAQMNGTAQEPGSRHMVGRDTPNPIGKSASPEVQRTNTAYLLSPSTDTFLFMLDPRLRSPRSIF